MNVLAQDPWKGAEKVEVEVVPQMGTFWRIQLQDQENEGASVLVQKNRQK